MIKPHSRQEFALVALVYLAATYVIWSVLEPWLQIDIWGNFDNRNYHPNMIAYGVNRLISGEWPFWNPYQAGGVPFFAALQGMVLYPPTWLAFVFSTETTHVFSKYLHLVLSGFSIYFYLRILRLHPLACFIGGLFFMTGNFYLAFTVFETATYPLATIGLLLGAAEKIFQTNSKPYDSSANRWSLVFVIVLTFEVFAGYIQSVVFTGYFLCLYIPFRWGQLYFNNRSREDIWYSFIRFGSMAILTLMLASIQLLPTFEMSTHSATHNLEKGMDMSYVNISFLPSPSLSETLNDTVVPILQTLWDKLFWLLIAVGLFFSKRFRPLVGFYLIVTLVFLTMARGPDTSLYNIYYSYFPTGNWFRWPEKFLLMSNLTISILVGLGLHQCHQFLSARKWPPINYVLWFYCFGIFGIAFLSRYSSAGVQIEPHDWHWKAFGKHYVPYQGSKIVRSAKHLLHNPARFILHDRDPYENAEPVFNFLKQKNQEERVVSLLNIPWDYVPDLPVKWGMREQLYSIEDYEPLMSERYVDFVTMMGRGLFFHIALPTNLKMMSLFSTKWLLVSRNWEKKYFRKKPPKDFVQVYADDEFSVYQFPRFLPRAYVSTKIVSLPEEDILTYLSAESFDPFEEIVVNETIAMESSLEENPIISAEIVDYQPEKVVIDLPQQGSEGVLVLTDNYDPNWRVTVDGIKADIVPVNFLFRGVVISSEDRRVVFTYQPVYFYWGAAISFSGIILIVLFHFMLKRRGYMDTKPTV
jgi:hypothetical protein